MTVQEDIAKIYVGYYGRSPEPEGWNYWIGENTKANPLSLAQIAASFSVQPESKALYPFLVAPAISDPTTFITQVYQNLFNRNPDTEGLNYWKGKLAAALGDPQATGAMIIDIISGAKDDANGNDRTTLNNKVAVAMDWGTSVLALTNLDYENNAAAKASAKEVLQGVTDDASTVAAAKAKTDVYVADAASANPGETFNLISSVETKTGGTGDDKFVGTNTTLNDGDNLNGGGGTDTLSITDVSGTTVTPVLTSIEKIELLATHSSLTTFNLSASTGVTSAALNNSSGGLKLEGAAAIADLSATNTTGNASLIASYKASAVSGSSDVQKIALENAVLNGAIAIDDVETFEITATGTNTTTNIIGAHTINVSGSGSFAGEFRPSTDTGTFTSTGSGAMNINFQSNKSYTVVTGSGNDNLEFGSTNTVDVKSGGGDDTLHFDSSLDSTDKIDGGSGKDTLVLDSFANTATHVNKATGIEVLVAQNASNGFTASDYTNVHEFVFAGGPSGSRVNVRGVETEDRIVFTADQSQGDEAVRFEGESAGQTLTMELRAQTGSSGEVVIHANTNTGNDYAAVGFQSNISSVIIDSTGVTGASTNANMVHAVDNGSNNYYAFANDGGIANFTITGTHALNIGAKDGAEMSASSDTFGFMNAVNVNAGAFKADLKIAGSNSDDTLTGGDGNDVFYGMSGDDTLRGNDGSDQFRFVGTNSTDKIKDFVSGTDKIGFNLFDFGNTTATTAGQTLSTDDYVDNRSSITSMGTADNHKMIELQTGLSSGQITGDTGAAIEAYVMVFNTSTNKAELWYDNDWSTSASRRHIATLDNTSELSDVVGLSATDFVEFVA